MKIIIANYRYYIAGGPERYMFNFMDIAKKNGIECIPFSIDYENNLPTPYSKYFATGRNGKSAALYSEIKKTPKTIWNMLRMSIYNYEAERKLRKLIRDEKADALYVLQEINALSPAVIRAAKKEGIRVVHRISDFFMFCPKSDFLCGTQICEKCLNGNYSSAIKNRCVKGSLFATLVRVFAMKLYTKMKIFDDVDGFVCTCEFTKNKMIQGGINPNKITCIPTFVSYQDIIPCYENKGYFLYLGRVAEQKGIEIAIRAMSFLRKYDTKLVITGKLDDGVYSNYIRGIIKENNLEDLVEFVGFQNGDVLKKTVSGAIAVINPALWYENMPNTVIEAFAYGKPVIASYVGSLIELIDSRNGMTFELGNFKELSECMEKLLVNPELCKKMGRYARMMCEEKYDAQKHFNKVMELFVDK